MINLWLFWVPHFWTSPFSNCLVTLVKQPGLPSVPLKTRVKPALFMDRSFWRSNFVVDLGSLQTEAASDGFELGRVA